MCSHLKKITNSLKTCIYSVHLKEIRKDSQTSKGKQLKFQIKDPTSELFWFYFMIQQFIIQIIPFWERLLWIFHQFQPNTSGFCKSLTWYQVLQFCVCSISRGQQDWRKVQQGMNALILLETVFFLITVMVIFDVQCVESRHTSGRHDASNVSF